MLENKDTQIEHFCFHPVCDPGPGYRFTIKGLTINLNLRTNLNLEYNIKSLTYIQKNFRFQAWFLPLLNYVFYLFDMISGLKVIKKGNDCVTLHFA